MRFPPAGPAPGDDRPHCARPLPPWPKPPRYRPCPASPAPASIGSAPSVSLPPCESGPGHRGRAGCPPEFCWKAGKWPGGAPRVHKLPGPGSALRAAGDPPQSAGRPGPPGDRGDDRRPGSPNAGCGPDSSPPQRCEAAPMPPAIPLRQVPARPLPANPP